MKGNWLELAGLCCCIAWRYGLSMPMPYCENLLKSTCIADNEFWNDAYLDILDRCPICVTIVGHGELCDECDQLTNVPHHKPARMCRAGLMCVCHFSGLSGLCHSQLEIDDIAPNSTSFPVWDFYWRAYIPTDLGGSGHQTTTNVSPDIHDPQFPSTLEMIGERANAGVTVVNSFTVNVTTDLPRPKDEITFRVMANSTKHIS